MAMLLRDDNRFSEKHQPKSRTRWKLEIDLHTVLLEKVVSRNDVIRDSTHHHRLVYGRKRTSVCTTSGLTNRPQTPEDREKEKEASHRSEKRAATKTESSQVEFPTDSTC